MDHVRRPPLSHGHVQRVEDQFSPEMRRHRPPNHAPTPRIEDDGEVQEARPGRDVRDVGDPELVRAVGGERPADQVGCRPGPRIAARGCDEGPAAHPHQAGRLHEPGDALAAHKGALRGQFGMDAGRPIGLAGAGVDRADLLGEGRVGLGPNRARAGLPRVVPAGRDAQHLAHGGDAVGGLVGLHALESVLGIEPVSRANQAAAFFKMSRSSRSILFSRRSRRNSARSSVVSPSSRRPSSRSAWRSQSSGSSGRTARTAGPAPRASAPHGPAR